jgi:hypothetical protein
MGGEKKVDVVEEDLVWGSEGSSAKKAQPVPSPETWDKSSSVAALTNNYDSPTKQQGVVIRNSR